MTARPGVAPVARVRPRPTPLALPAALLLLASVCLVARADPGTAGSSEDLAKGLIVMIEGQLGDAPTTGAGIIFAVHADRLYIATANHVVRKRTDPSVEARDLAVRLDSLPGERVPATLLRDWDKDLDLAVLLVRNVSDRGIPAQEVPFSSLGDPAALERRDPLFHMGYAAGRPWAVNLNPVAFDSRSGGQLKFISSELAAGYSGGGLFDQGWRLVGMVVEDRAPEGRAAAVDRILETLDGWGYRVDLAAAGGPAAQQPETTPERPEPEPPPGPRARFRDPGDGTVVDARTGLQWARRDNGADVTWYEANDYCGSLSLAGHSDWRLPTIGDLETVFDPGALRRFKILGGIELTDCCPWSSTSPHPGAALALDFVDGGQPAGGLGDPITHVRALCVRSQRPRPFGPA